MVSKKNGYVLEHKLDPLKFKFLSYYNNTSPIYINLKPFITLLKGSGAQSIAFHDEILKDFSKWIKKASEFEDVEFTICKIDPDMEFIESQGMCILLLERGQSARSYYEIYNASVRMVEEKRVIEIQSQISELQNQVTQLSGQHQQLEQKHDVKHACLQKIMATLEEFASNHGNMLQSLLDIMKSYK